MRKINYIHLNCVLDKWKFAERWEDYEHSSARFYVKNKSDGFEPVHHEELTYQSLLEAVQEYQIPWLYTLARKGDRGRTRTHCSSSKSLINFCHLLV